MSTIYPVQGILCCAVWGDRVDPTRPGRQVHPDNRVSTRRGKPPAANPRPPLGAATVSCLDAAAGFAAIGSRHPTTGDTMFDLCAVEGALCGARHFPPPGGRQPVDDSSAQSRH